ncbi:MAG: hypothetical protein AB7T06_47590 [Kofleriaceae bacterium]
MRVPLVVLLLAGCGDDGGANKLPDAPRPPDSSIDVPVDEPTPDAPVMITTMSSFSITGGCGLAFDPAASEVLVYPCSGAAINRYSTAGALLGTIARPGEAADDVDLDVVSAAFTLGSTNIPAGTLLFVNGETGPADLYAGATTLAAQFGASHSVGGALHVGRGTVFLVQDRVPGATDGNRVAEIDPATGAVVQTWQTTPDYTVNYGDIDVCQSSGNLFIVSNAETTMAEFTPTGTLVAEYPLPTGSSDGSGLAIVDGTGTAWIGTPSGTAFQVTGLPCN